MCLCVCVCACLCVRVLRVCVCVFDVRMCASHTGGHVSQIVESLPHLQLLTIRAPDYSELSALCDIANTTQWPTTVTQLSLDAYQTAICDMDNEALIRRYPPCIREVNITGLHTHLSSAHNYLSHPWRSARMFKNAKSSSSTGVGQVVYSGMSPKFGSDCTQIM